MIVTITNQKGGIGKTTTAQNLGQGLAYAGYKVLLIDLDAQSNLTMAAGADPSQGNAHDIMTQKAPAAEVIQHLKENLDIIPGSLEMAALDLELSELGREFRLKEALELIRGQYDFIIIDTPPALNITTMNALTAADRVIIPAQADIFSLDAVQKLHSTAIETIRKYTNKGIIVDGILLTRYKGRNILTKEMAAAFEEVATQLHTRVYNAKIRDTVALSESQTAAQDIYNYASSNAAAADYAEFTREFLEGIRERG